MISMTFRRLMRIEAEFLFKERRDSHSPQSYKGKDKICTKVYWFEVWTELAGWHDINALCLPEQKNIKTAKLASVKTT